MKKYILIIAAAFAAALLVQGCDPNENVDLKSKNLTLSVFSDAPETKADPTFETKITQFDFFFFSNEDGSTPIPGMHGHAGSATEPASSVTLETGLNKPYAALRKVTSYVYVIANYTGTIDHTRDWTLAELKKLPVTGALATVSGDNVTFCSDLVMDSYSKATGKYTTKLVPTDVDENATVPIGLTRVASKMVMNFTIPAQVSGTMDYEKWTPVLKDIRAYFVNALNNRATIDATPIKRSDLEDEVAGNYITYPTAYAITPDPKTVEPQQTGNYEFTAGIVYTYPQTWDADESGEPYFKVQMTWRSNYRGTANFYYKIRVPKPVSGVCTIDRNTCYEVDVTLNVIDTENEYVVVDPANYTITNWAISEWHGGSEFGVAHFFFVPNTSFELYSDGEVTIPIYSSSTVSAYFTKISYTHYGPASTTDNTFKYDYSWEWDPETEKNAAYLTAGDASASSAPDEVLPKALDPNEYSLTVADNNKSVLFKHSLNNIYSVREITFEIKSPESEDPVIITIKQHPAIEIRKIPAKNAFVNGHFARNDKDTEDAYGRLIGTMWGPTEEYDTGLMKYRSNEHVKKHSIQTPLNHDTYYIDLSQQGLANVYSDWRASVHAGQVFLTEITVSAFNNDNKEYTVNSTKREFRIGDPRVPAGNYYSTFDQAHWSVSNQNFWLPPYLKSDTQLRVSGSESFPPEPDQWDYQTQAIEHGAWEEPLKILIASQGNDVRNVIAPKFLVSSTLNGMNPGITYNGGVRRAATYQENGYPAGRWRLPTEAEIAFIAARQLEGLLPELFVQKDTPYLCANREYVRLGRVEDYDPSVGINVYSITNLNAGSYYNRFVYDLWYWGDAPEEHPNRYHPNKHEH